jgi:hypothetical protein
MVILFTVKTRIFTSYTFRIKALVSDIIFISTWRAVRCTLIIGGVKIIDCSGWEFYTTKTVICAGAKTDGTFRVTV